MVSMEPKSPRNAASTQGLSDSSLQPRVASATLPAQAAHAPEFVPSEELQPSVSDQHVDKERGDQKTSDTDSDQEKASGKKAKKRTKAEKEAEREARKQQALDEEWWSGDEIFVPSLRN